MTTATAVCPLHVGRDLELDHLRELADSRAVTLIAGEAGVGKSRMGREAVTLAMKLGLPRFVGNCSPDPTVPYAPFVTALRRHCRSLNAEQLGDLFDGSAQLAANLLPEAVEVIGSRVMAPSQDGLFAAVWQLFRRLAGDDGCLLLLEDLHWADTDSLRLLGYLVREMDGLGVWLVGTYRSDELYRRHPLTQLLGELGREGRYEEISLRPLDRAGLQEMVSAIFDGTEVGDEFATALLERTSGNPFFTEELIKVLLDEGAIFRRAGDWERRDLHEIEMPVSVRDTLLSRTRHLDASTLEALQIAAVLGERIELDVLACVTGLSLIQVEEVITEGVRLQLLAERREGPRILYGFRHALTREALVDELVGPERRRVHRRIAEALRSLHEHDLDSVASELAEHFAEGGDTTEAVEFGVRAARRAAASMAPAEAGDRYNRALGLMDRSHENRLPVLLEAAEAVGVHDDRLATAFANEALELAGIKADGLARSRSLSVLQRAAWNAGDSQTAADLAREAYESAKGLDGEVEILALARLARILTLNDRHTEAAELLAGGIPLATRIGHHQALAIMHGTRMLHLVEGNEFDDSFLASVKAARRAGDAVQEAITTANAGYLCLWSGALVQSREHLVRAVELSGRVTPNDRYARAGLSWLLSLTGEFDQATQLAEPLADAASTVTGIPTRIVALTALCEIAQRRGDSDLPQLVEKLWSIASRTGEAQRSVPAISARARLGLRERPGDAIPMFQDALSYTTNNRGTGSHWLFSPDLARHLAGEGRLIDLKRWYDDVHRLTLADPNGHNRAADALCRGYLSSAEGDDVTALGSLTEAERAYREMPCPARTAEALLALADLHWRSDRVTESRTAAQAAADIAARITAPALAGEAALLVQRASTPSVLATVMFTDIVGSTRQLSSVGDRAWNSVIERHNAIVRRELARWNGREIDTTGDGFLAAFDSPAAGVRCAMAIRDSLATVGIPIRAGLHTGECQASGPELSGLAVHIAARVSARADAGEVLVSGTVQDLVAGSSLLFEDRGVHELKGVPGRWRIAAVSSS